MTQPEPDPGQWGDPNRRLVIIAGRQILIDGEGFMWHFEEWDENVAQALAIDSGLEALAECHWQVLRCLRHYYMENGRAPLNRQLAKATGLSLLEIEALFPGGIKYGARRLAGLPNPRTCE